MNWVVWWWCIFFCRFRFCGGRMRCTPRNQRCWKRLSQDLITFDTLSLRPFAQLIDMSKTHWMWALNVSYSYTEGENILVSFWLWKSSTLRRNKCLYPSVVVVIVIFTMLSSCTSLFFSLIWFFSSLLYIQMSVSPYQASSDLDHGLVVIVMVILMVGSIMAIAWFYICQFLW